MFTIGNMLSQVAGAAKNGGTPSEAVASPPPPPPSSPPAPPPPTELAEAAAATSPQPPPPSTAEVRQHSNRKATSGTTSAKNSTNREFQFFFEDEVFHIDRKGRVCFGIVTGTAESYSSDDEEEEVNDVLGKGEVRVAFYPEGKETVRTEKSIGLADRTLMPGDVVRRRLPGEKHLSGQAGYVRDVNVHADVKVLGTKYIIRNVPSERLRPISEWSRDVSVCLGNWIGYTVGVDESVVLRSSYGALLEITSTDFHKFKDAYGTCEREVFSPSVYYPNNVVIGRLPPLDRVTNLTPDLPLPTNYKRRSLYTVESVKTTGINVAWTFKATPHCENGQDLDPMKQPKSCITGADLAKVKRLNIYESYLLQIHDRFYLKYSQCDKLVKCTLWEQEQAKLFQSIYQRQKAEENKQYEQSDQVKRDSASVPGVGHEVLPSPSAASSSRTSHMNKARRLSGKPSNQRLNRSLGDNEISNTPPKLSTITNSAGKKTKTNTDEIWETDEEQPQATTDSTDVADAISDSEVAPLQARIVTRTFKRRPSKKKSRPSKKITLHRKETDPKDGDEIVVETLVVYSSLTVVWQDGSVETGIPSTELYPIHHLDNHEFFPGDFVSKANDYSPSQIDYGVIQSVDHDERIAKVKWFNIYGNLDNPVPSCKEVEELSVYDLKDHADYQYRPGTMVIRVSNFTGEDLNSTAGQVIDNFPDGRVRVWWAKGHITMCYPQDLFEIHQSDTQDAYDSDDSDNSWETQSENSHTNDPSHTIKAEEYIIKGMDRAKEAIERLEKIFQVLPAARKPVILNDLLAVYKNCRQLDQYLKSDFFHEDYFCGILAHKPKRDYESSTETSPQTVPSALPEIAQTNECAMDVNTTVQIEPPLSGQATTTSTPNKRKSSTLIDEVQCKKNSSSERINVEDTAEQAMLLANVDLTESEAQLTYSEVISKYRAEYNEMMGTARTNIRKALKKCLCVTDDSGVHSRGENSSSDVTSADCKDCTEDNGNNQSLTSSSETSIELIANRDADVCEVFCFLIKEQMIKCQDAMAEKFMKRDYIHLEEQQITDVDDAEEYLERDSQADNNDDDQVMEQSLNLNALSESLPPLECPSACSSPSQVQAMLSTSNNCFEVVPNAPIAHHFIGNLIMPNNKAQYQRAVQREYAMLHASLPPGVVVRAYEDRMDLISVMMVGPKRTPYENALFFFDFQLGSDYPKSPPTCHYISYCTERLNPNLYEEGKVCVSLLGTWSGRDTEVWTPQSTMLQVLVSIQGLILVDEPYYNEAGYEKQRGTQLGNENSRVYNEMAIIKIVHSTIKQLQNPPFIFRKELIEHYKKFGADLHGRMRSWSEYSAEAQRLKITSIKNMPADYKTLYELPEFPLLPCSRGFCIAVKGVLETLQKELTALQRSKDIEPAVAAVATAPRAELEDV
ncbi:(E3-independent) E2 ubiquitin-conjugating enzyme isoform X1 [Drosophila albomicans]|uniref:(E3-independent) E2 ubiquitin-conjugating enzyme isoform X1 n=2 Tax=Drosophila albomicans TaxID=7291 RepID=A0A6P8ZF22_DROAB|nr:(E3-independent) E2 ubiquitin-conjugating enzyme isoform X1 [Drosophila albomicans]